MLGIGFDGDVTARGAARVKALSRKASIVRGQAHDFTPHRPRGHDMNTRHLAAATLLFAAAGAAQATITTVTSCRMKLVR